jgi:putative nucleotidyltransferase with HDIG domain
MVENIRARIGEVELLPTFSAIAGNVMAVIEDPKSSVSDLVKHMDPSLVSEVLKVANSAYYGRSNFRRIATVEQAVTAIGFVGLSQLVLQMPFLSILKGNDPLFDREGFVRHSFMCAILARTVSSAFTLGNPNSVYVSGLLHDIGSMVISQYFKEEWAEIDRLVAAGDMERLNAEQEVLSMDHAGVGALLLEKWDLPAGIVNAVRLHHSREEIGEDSDAYVTWFANVMSNNTGEGDLQDFQAFYDKERDLIQREMPDRFLLSQHVELFETAFGHLTDTEGFLKGGSEGNND